jgi:hypothetical protein
MMRSRIEGVKARGREGVSSGVPFTLNLSPFTKYCVNMRQIQTNLKFSIYNSQFTIIIHPTPCTFYPFPSISIINPYYKLK